VLSGHPSGSKTLSCGVQQSRSISSIVFPGSVLHPGNIAAGEKFDDGLLDEAGCRNPALDGENFHAANELGVDVDEELLRAAPPFPDLPFLLTGTPIVIGSYREEDTWIVPLA